MWNKGKGETVGGKRVWNKGETVGGKRKRVGNKGETVGGKRVWNKGETVAIYSVSNLFLGTTSEAFKTA